MVSHPRSVEACSVVREGSTEMAAEPCYFRISRESLGLATPVIRVHFAALWLQLILVLNSPVIWVSIETSSIVVGRFSTETLLSFRNSTITGLPEPSCDRDTPWPTTPGKFNR